MHLDFHTSELIEGVGEKWSAEAFQEAIAAAKVESVNLFAKCHHSWSYYPTKVGRRHPNLVPGLDLLGEQIQSLHDIGVRAPIYFTVGWSANDALDHPDWRVIGPDGKPLGTNVPAEDAPLESPRGIASWEFLCPTGAYRDLIVAQTAEICARYPVDGFWFDICIPLPCRCARCAAQLDANGVDPTDIDAARDQNLDTWRDFTAECNAVIDESHPDATVFYNGLANFDATPDLLAAHTHIELEDLPTTWGGYDRFPLRSRRFVPTGRQLAAMSGAFHTMWGEFGGYKHPDAMRYEASAMISYGANCSFGDQLHPSGAIDPERYRCIGEAYKYVEEIAPYGLGGSPYNSLAIWFSGQLDRGEFPPGAPHDQGIAEALMESGLDFEVVEGLAPDLSDYDLVVLPGGRFLTRASAGVLAGHIEAGGGVLAFGESPLSTSGEVLLDVGADYVGPARTDVDYFVAGDVLAAVGDGFMVRSPFVHYSSAPRWRTTPESEELAAIHEPPFSRTKATYCSHQNAPFNTESNGHAAATRRGRVVFFAHSIGDEYHRHGARLHRELIHRGVTLAGHVPTTHAALPSAGRVSVVRQPQHRRTCVHLLYAPPLQRGRCLVIEDLPELRDVEVTFRSPDPIDNARLPLEGRMLKLDNDGDRLRLVVPRVRSHQVVVLNWK